MIRRKVGGTRLVALESKDAMSGQQHRFANTQQHNPWAYVLLLNRRHNSTIERSESTMDISVTIGKICVLSCTNELLTGVFVRLTSARVGTNLCVSDQSIPVLLNRLV